MHVRLACMSASIGGHGVGVFAAPLKRDNACAFANHRFGDRPAAAVLEEMRNIPATRQIP
jgi:hypothetical protein